MRRGAGGGAAVTEWRNCYNDGWQGVIVPEAFAHPAKFSRGLIRRIYEHMLAAGYLAPGDSVVDCFGGIGAGALDAMSMGLHWTGVELEPRFVELGNRNIAKWQRDLAMLGDRVGTARLLQGDSRRLLEVVGAGMAGVVSSPPFENQIHGQDEAFLRAVDADRVKRGLQYSTTRHHSTDYGTSPGQLGAMPSGDYAAAVISSPPYADAVNGTGEGPGARYDTVHHNADTAQRLSSDNGYGATDGQLGRMAGEGWSAAVSSPPFGKQQEGGGIGAWMRGDNPDYPYAHESKHRDGGSRPGYMSQADDPANLANDTGGTFWAAARLIVEQTYAALRPGGYAAWVTGDFIRNGQRVEFGRQWMQLCEACGFQMVEWITASKVDKHPAQLDLFGGSHSRDKERVSFFRRMANKKNPQNAITSENVIILRKPL